MKAAVYTKYGPPEVLRIEDIPQPQPAANEVLIKVFAASVNSWDYERLTGQPFLYKMLSGFSKPRQTILGADVAGRVESVGPGVTKFAPGDEVFGDLSTGNWGAFAEFVCADEKPLTHKPQNISFEQAAALPQAAVMALQAVRDYGQTLPGKHVLINGAGGGVGSFAIQIAKYFGANVTAVDSTAKLELMRTLGADQVIDYTKEDFTRTGNQYDVVLF